MDCGGKFYADHDAMDLFSIREYISQYNIFGCEPSRGWVFTDSYFSTPQIFSHELLARNCAHPDYSFVYSRISILYFLYSFVVHRVKEDQMRAIIDWGRFYSPYFELDVIPRLGYDY